VKMGCGRKYFIEIKGSPSIFWERSLFYRLRALTPNGSFSPFMVKAKKEVGSSLSDVDRTKKGGLKKGERSDSSAIGKNGRNSPRRRQGPFQSPRKQGEVYRG